MSIIKKVDLAQRNFAHPLTLQRMLSRLPQQASDLQNVNKLPNINKPPLAALTTRDSDDATIALLDSCAMVLDVLDFYQKIMDRESYLGSANELRSILELSRTIGYGLNPGAAATTFLAFTVDDNVDVATIPKNMQVQNVPQQDASPQTFETDNELIVKPEWNQLYPYHPEEEGGRQSVNSAKGELKLQGTDTGLQVGDAILITTNTDSTPLLFLTLQTIENKYEEGYTSIKWKKIEWPKHDREFTEEFWWKEDGSESFKLKLTNIYKIFAFRQQVGCFGHNAPAYLSLQKGTNLPNNWDTNKPSVWQNSAENNTGTTNYYTDADLYLSQHFAKIFPDSWVVLVDGATTKVDGSTTKVDDPTLGIYKIDNITTKALADFGLSARVTGLKLKNYSGTKEINKPDAFKFRSTSIYVQSEKLDLFEETKLSDDAIIPHEENRKPPTILLNLLVHGLSNGKKLILTGEPERQRELVSEVIIIDKVGKEEDPIRTKLTLQNKLNNTYKLDTVTLYGNVVTATHGETITEILGSGNSTIANQTFSLQKKPLTYIPTATVSGIASTLQIRVNDVLWHEVANLHQAQSNDKAYMVELDENSKTTIIFGDGKKGARLPTGQENIVATYRVGIGRVGQIPADSLTLLQNRPLAIKEVTNPLATTGGVDLENISSAKENAPLTVLTMDRIVSLQDFENFSQAFIGIAKAQATLLQQGKTLHLTIADQYGKVVTETSALYRSLKQAIETFRTPGKRVVISNFRPLFFIVVGKLKILEAYLFEKVYAQVIKRLKKEFSFKQRQFAQAVTATEVISSIQQVEGVMAVDLDELYFEEKTLNLNTKLEARGAYFDKGDDKFIGAELLTIADDGIDLTEVLV